MKINEADFKIKISKRLYSKEHLLADDLSKMMEEPKRFAAYLGLAQLYEEADLRALARYVREKNDLPAEARGKYFFASVKNLRKKTGAHLKNLRRTLFRQKLKGSKKSKTKNKNGKNKKNRKRSQPGSARRSKTRASQGNNQS